MDFVEANISFIVLLSAGVLGLGVLWRKVVIPVANAVTMLREFLPLLPVIRDEFKPNHGESFHDKVLGGMRALCEEQKAIRKEMEFYHSPKPRSEFDEPAR